MESVKLNAVAAASRVKIQHGCLLVISILWVYLLGYRDGYKFTPAWIKDQELEHYRNGKYPSPDEHLPRPLVTDLDSDGQTEIVLITNDLKLVVLQTGVDILADGARLSRLPVAHSRQLPGKIRPVAMETGYLSAFEALDQTRHQVIVVLFPDWTVHCYNHSLFRLWDRRLMPGSMLSDPEQTSSRAAGILITSHALEKGDTGCVIVGGDFVQEDEDAARRARDEGKQRTPVIPVAGVTALHDLGSSQHHFSTFALSGDNGTTRWHHLPGDFEQKVLKKRPPHHWKLGLERGSWHTGEVHWLKYTENLLQHTPHHWSAVSDTRLDLADIKKVEKQRSADDPDSLYASPIADLLGLDGEHIPGLAFGGLRPHSPQEHVRHPNAIVVHHDRGIEVLDYRTGRPLTRLKVSDPRSVHVDLDDDGTLEKVTAEFQGTECHAEVSVTQPRIKTVFKRTICDVIGWFSGGSWMPMFLMGNTEVKENVRLAVSPVVVKTVAKKHGLVNHILGKNLRSERRGYDALFLTSFGLLTSLSAAGEVHWQSLVPSPWAEQSKKFSLVSGDNRHQTDVYNNAFRPSLVPLALKIFGKETAALVSGWDTISLVDLQDGYILGKHSLPCQPLEQPITADFNGDGATDVIISCPLGYVGMKLTRQPQYMYNGVVLVAVVLSIVMMISCCSLGPDEEEAFS